eukprot:1355297-Amphidinium_carterae.1
MRGVGDEVVASKPPRPDSASWMTVHTYMSEQLGAIKAFHVMTCVVAHLHARRWNSWSQDSTDPPCRRCTVIGHVVVGVASFCMLRSSIACAHTLDCLLCVPHPASR